MRRHDGRVYVHAGFQVAWLDYTDPDAVMWWGASWRRALDDLGYDGGMLDLGELIPPDSVLGRGTPGLQAHNRYPLLYARSAWQDALAARPDGDFTLLLRSGALGAQRYQSAQWNGDAVMRWEGPDGLRSMIPAALSFGLSGFPYWHAEVAGYVQADLNPDQERELWLRWLQLATWTSLLRDHLGDYPRGGDRRLARRRHPERVSPGRARPSPAAAVPVRPGGRGHPDRAAADALRGASKCPTTRAPGSKTRRFSSGRRSSWRRSSRLARPRARCTCRPATGWTTGAARSTRAARR